MIVYKPELKPLLNESKSGVNERENGYCTGGLVMKPTMKCMP